ncbi:MAG: hypothetical protein IJM20_00355 [Clostridia bacterium]|nr:hypothetical protein [Clostridia bacterium]
MSELLTETKRLLALHFALYPEMEPQDAVKLLYQSEFGCGHFLPDAEKARAYLLEEWRSVPRDPDHRREDELGGGFVRVHLEPIETEAETLRLAEKFIASAKERCGSGEGMEARLAALSALVEEGGAPFSKEELEAFLEKYRKAGCPAVHHSESFRKKYHPAYRVIRKRQDDAGE